MSKGKDVKDRHGHQLRSIVSPGDEKGDIWSTDVDGAAELPQMSLSGVLDQMETFSGAWHLFSLAPQIRMPSLTACVPFCQRRFLLYSTLAFAFQYTHY